MQLKKTKRVIHNEHNCLKLMRFIIQKFKMFMDFFIVIKNFEIKIYY